MKPEVEAALAVEQLYWLIAMAAPKSVFDVLTPEGFDEAVADLARRWGEIGDLSNPRMVSRALLSMRGVDWEKLTPEQRSALIDKAAEKVKLPLGVQRTISADMGLAAKAIYKGTMEGLGEQGLKVKASFRHYDKRVAKLVSESSAHFVSENGMPQRMFSSAARQTVEQGVKLGLGRKQMAEALERSVGVHMAAVNDGYWSTVSSAFVGRGRSYSQMAGFDSAGIDRYRILSVLDERTTETCRFLDGKTFSVASSVREFQEVERATKRDPVAIKTKEPWVREGYNASGQRELYVNRPGGGRTSLATITQPGLGTQQPGQYGAPTGRSTPRSDASLQALGLSWPPYHGHCRTTTVPEI